MDKNTTLHNATHPPAYMPMPSPADLAKIGDQFDPRGKLKAPVRIRLSDNLPDLVSDVATVEHLPNKRIRIVIEASLLPAPVLDLSSLALPMPGEADRF